VIPRRYERHSVYTRASTQRACPIAESIGQVPGGEEGAGIAWSPDGTRLAVLATTTPSGWQGTLYVMNADGSERRPLAESVLVQHSLGSPNIVWSPDGTYIAYATMTGERERLRIWSAGPDGSAPVLVFDAGDATGANGLDGTGLDGGPVWSPDGTQIAFRNDPIDDEEVGSSRTPTERRRTNDALQPRSYARLARRARMRRFHHDQADRSESIAPADIDDLGGRPRGVQPRWAMTLRWRPRIQPDTDPSSYVFKTFDPTSTRITDHDAPPGGLQR
jgi:dipeptidyl aminopeptidase/acylaminoacyl peptidase